jgi:iron complex transport system substrate-binding protein
MKRAVFYRFTLPLLIALTVLWALSMQVIPGYAANRFPGRIVSLGPAITEKIYLLGAQERLVGVTTYCQRPPEAQTKERVGNVTQVSIEKVVSLSPDLVLATSLSDQKAIKKLHDLGIRVISFNEPRSFAEINEQFLDLGRIIGKEREARTIVGNAEKKVNLMRRKADRLKKPRVFVQIGSNPLFTATKGSFLNDFVEFAGGINVAADAPRGFYSRERVLKDNPDIILIVAMEGIAAETEKQTWQRFKTLSAAKRHTIYVMDPYNVCSPTPVTFSIALETIVKLLHPQLTEGRHIEK